MKTLTWNDFKEFEPCYNPQERYGDWKGTMLDLMNHPEIPDDDKIWAFTRKGIVSDKTLRLFAVACAREVQHLLTDERFVKALDVAEAFAHGRATEDELKAAWDAEWAAAWDAAWDAEWAAKAAAWAAKAAGWDAGWDAGSAAAWAAAIAKQVQIAIELIKQHER